MSLVVETRTSEGSLNSLPSKTPVTVLYAPHPRQKDQPVTSPKSPLPQGHHTPFGVVHLIYRSPSDSPVHLSDYPSFLRRVCVSPETRRVRRTRLRKKEKASETTLSEPKTSATGLTAKVSYFSGMTLIRTIVDTGPDRHY